MRTSRFSIAAIVASVVLGASALIGAPAQAYPTGIGLTLNIRPVEATSRIELVVRHALPWAPVQVVFEGGVKTRSANRLGIAVFSYLKPVQGVHVAVARSGDQKAVARQYSETFHLAVYSAYAGSRNTVSITSGKPGMIMTIMVAGKKYSAVTGRDYVARVSFIVPKAGTYKIYVYCDTELEKVYTAISR